MAKTRMLKIIEDDSNRELIKWLETLDTVKVKRSLFSKKIKIWFEGTETPECLKGKGCIIQTRFDTSGIIFK